jgi:hypothetical protein
MNNGMKATGGEEEEKQQQQQNLAYECNGMNELKKLSKKGHKTLARSHKDTISQKTCKFCKPCKCKVSFSMF